MKKLKRVFVIGLSACLLTGCEDVKQEFSETLHEDAVILETVYTPSRHETEIGVTAFKSGSIGMDYSGNVGFRLGKNLQISSVTIPERFAVVFKCQHGEFIVSRKEVYEKFKDRKGKNVDVAYREVYRVTYEAKDGKREVVNRALTDYNFLDATIK